MPARLLCWRAPIMQAVGQCARGGLFVCLFLRFATYRAEEEDEGAPVLELEIVLLQRQQRFARLREADAAAPVRAIALQEGVNK
eukprot:4321404-Pyramimonas_sp.AAC.2